MNPPSKDEIYRAVIRGAGALTSVTTSNTASCGGSVNPPGMPCCMRGIRIESRKVSQLSFVSRTATMVQPSADGAAAWNICPGGRLPSAGRYIDIDTLTRVIEMAILGVLKEHEARGYERKKRMAELAGGSGGVSFGSLYLALNRLELAGAVDLVMSGDVLLEPLVSGRRPLNEARAALDELAGGAVLRTLLIP